MKILLILNKNWFKNLARTMLKKGKCFFYQTTLIKFSYKNALFELEDLPSDLRPHIKLDLEMPESVIENLKEDAYKYENVPMAYLDLLDTEED